jgi:hypothetical protein
MIRLITLDAGVGGQNPAHDLPQVKGMPYTKSNLQVEQRGSQGRMRKPRIRDRQVTIEFAFGCRELGATAAAIVRRCAAGTGVSR